MHKAWLFIFLLLTTLGTAVHSDPLPMDDEEERAHRNGCSADQRSMNLCSSYRLRVLDDELNHLYKQQLSRLKGSPDAKRLVLAQRAWLKYIEADCLYQAGPAEDSGSIWPVQYGNCMSTHLRDRIRLLQSFVACTQNGCIGE